MDVEADIHICAALAHSLGRGWGSGVLNFMRRVYASGGGGKMQRSEQCETARRGEGGGVAVIYKGECGAARQSPTALSPDADYITASQAPIKPSGHLSVRALGPARRSGFAISR